MRVRQSKPPVGITPDLSLFERRIIKNVIVVGKWLRKRRMQRCQQLELHFFNVVVLRYFFAQA